MTVRILCIKSRHGRSLTAVPGSAGIAASATIRRRQVLLEITRWGVLDCHNCALGSLFGGRGATYRYSAFFILALNVPAAPGCTHLVVTCGRCFSSWGFTVRRRPSCSIATTNVRFVRLDLRRSLFSLSQPACRAALPAHALIALCLAALISACQGGSLAPSHRIDALRITHARTQQSSERRWCSLPRQMPVGSPLAAHRAL